MQDKLLLQQDKLPSDFEFSFQTKFDEISLETSEGNVLNALFFKVDKPKGVILLFHNNTRNIEHWGLSTIFYWI